MIIPWKETLLLFLLIGLNLSFNNLQLKPQYVKIITENSWVRFMIIFATAFLLFSLDLGGQYSFSTTVLVSAFVSIVMYAIFSDISIPIKTEK